MFLYFALKNCKCFRKLILTLLTVRTKSLQTVHDQSAKIQNMSLKIRFKHTIYYLLFLRMFEKKKIKHLNIWSGRSLMKMINNNTGPRILPWGITLRTGSKVEKELFSLTLCCLSLRKLAIKLSILPSIP